MLSWNGIDPRKFFALINDCPRILTLKNWSKLSLIDLILFKKRKDREQWVYHIPNLICKTIKIS